MWPGQLRYPESSLDHPASAGADPLADCEHSDTQAVLKHVFEGPPVDPEVARRLDERAARITEQVRRTHGVIDDETFQTLLAGFSGLQ